MGLRSSPLGHLAVRIFTRLAPPSAQEWHDVLQAIRQSALGWLACSLLVLLGGGYLCYLIEEQIIGTIFQLKEQKVIPHVILPELLNIASLICWSLILPATISLSILPLRVQSPDHRYKNRSLLLLFPREFIRSYRTFTLTTARCVALSLPLIGLWALFSFLVIFNPPLWALGIFLLIALKLGWRLARKPIATLGTPWISSLFDLPIKQSTQLAEGQFRQVGYLTGIVLVGVALIHYGIGRLPPTPTGTPYLLQQIIPPIGGFYLPWLLASPLIAKRAITIADLDAAKTVVT